MLRRPRVSLLDVFDDSAVGKPDPIAAAGDPRSMEGAAHASLLEAHESTEMDPS